MDFFEGTLVVVPVAFLVGQVLLPDGATFAWTALALGVPLLFGALGMTRPAIAVSSIAFSLHFILLSSPQWQQRVELVLFINETLALLLGIACAMLAFKLIQLRNRHWHGRRLLKAMLEDLGRLAGRDLTGAENWFGGRMADRLLQLAKHYPGEPTQQRNHRHDAISCLDLADELMHLRRCLTLAEQVADNDLGRFLASFRRVIQGDVNSAAEDALDQPLSELVTAIGRVDSTADRRLAIAALWQLRRIWKQWCQQAVPTAETTLLAR